MAGVDITNKVGINMASLPLGVMYAGLSLWIARSYSRAALIVAACFASVDVVASCIHFTAEGDPGAGVRGLLLLAWLRPIYRGVMAAV